MRWVMVAMAVVMSGRAQVAQKAKAQNVPEIPIEAQTDFLKWPPNVYLGEGIGVATNSRGHVFVYTRSQETRLFEFDQKGKYLREIGEGLYGFAFAHAVRVDAQDNIWAVDEGTNMVIKFNPEGRVLMVLGRRPEAIEGLPAPPANDEPYLFNRPTDVAWDAAGNIFVSDGYGNSRVVKYDKDGRFVKSAGTKGSAGNVLISAEPRLFGQCDDAPPALGSAHLFGFSVTFQVARKSYASLPPVRKS